MKFLSKFTLWVILASATLTVMAGSIIAPVLPLMTKGLGVEAVYAGLIITTHGLFIAIFSPLFGKIIDIIGPKKPFIFGLVVYGLAGGAGLLINSYWLMIISRAILGIGVAAFFTSISIIIFNLYEGAERHKIMGWRASANSFGATVWPLIGGFLGTFSWHLPFAVYMVGIPLGFLTLITVPETHKGKHPQSNKEDSVLKVFRSKPVLFVIYGLIFLTNVLLYVIVVFVPQLLAKIGISNPSYIGLFISVMAISAGLTAFMYGRIKSRLSYKRIVLVTMIFWTVGLTTISLGISSFLIAVSVALFGIGQGMLLPAIIMWVGESVAPAFRGRIMSYLGTFGFIGQFLSPIIFGVVLLNLGLNGVFLVGGSITAVLFLLFSVFMRE